MDDGKRLCTLQESVDAAWDLETVFDDWFTKHYPNFPESLRDDLTAKVLTYLANIVVVWQPREDLHG